MPFKRNELKNIALRAGLKDIRISGGDSFLKDFDYFLIGNAKQAVRKYILRKNDKESRTLSEDNPREKLREIILNNDASPGFIDDYLSYPLI